jgi:very-short-patch-repair endonuclease
MSDAPNPRRWQLTERSRTRARALRRNLTDAERLIWYGVRAHRLNGISFRRQAPIGPYIVDFVSHAAKLVVEIDGGQHFEDEHEKRDTRRDRFLERKGYRVLRFSNHDVMSNRMGVLERIAEVAQAAAPSLPSPASGGGGKSGASGGGGKTGASRETDAEPVR